MKTLKKFNEKLVRLEEALGVSPQEMARIGGCSRSTYYRYRNGETKPDVHFIMNIIHNENRINCEWLLKGKGPMLILDEKPEFAGNVTESYSEDLKFVRLPLINMKSEGRIENQLKQNGMKEPVHELPLSDDFIVHIIGSNPSSVFAMHVDCDSMSPTISRGSVVLVDESERDPVSDGIYVVAIDGLMRMKRIQRLPGNKLQLMTENSHYDPIVVDMDDESFTIKGRVVWIGQKM